MSTVSRSPTAVTQLAKGKERGKMSTDMAGDSNIMCECGEKSELGINWTDEYLNCR